MLDILTALFYFLRPILSIDLGYRFEGVDLLDIITLLLMAVFILKWLTMVLSGSARPLSKIDVGILVYCIWVVSISVVYSSAAVMGDVVKFILPMFSFIVFKSLIREREQFIKYIFLMLVGFLVPSIYSAALIIKGMGLSKVIYWTGLSRYKGAFLNTHNFGHSMTLMLMLLAIYLWLLYMGRKNNHWIERWRIAVLGFIGVFGLFNLYESYVRTAWLGLLIFLMVLLYKFNKKIAIYFTTAILLGSLLVMPNLKLVFFDIVQVIEGKRDVDRIGSGRPFIWKHNLDIYSGLTIDHKLAGVGVGNRGAIFSEQPGMDIVWNSHNDFLEVMMQTGFIGLLIFLFIQLQILLRINQLPRSDRLIFLALFIAVTAMNFASNSYVVRFSIGQMFYMTLAYIESFAAYSFKPKSEVNINTDARLGTSPRILSMRK